MSVQSGAGLRPLIATIDCAMVSTAKTTMVATTTATMATTLVSTKLCARRLRKLLNLF